MDRYEPIPTGTRANAGTVRRSSPTPALVLAIAGIHMAVVAALCLLVVPRHLPEPAPETVVPVIFVPAAPPAAGPPQILATAALPPMQQSVPADLAPLPPLQLPPQMRGPARPDAPRRTAARQPSPAPAVQTQPAQVPPQPAPPAAPAPPRSAASEQGTLAAWEARVSAAVQDAAIYPASARRLHREGRAQVQFDYDHGTVAHVAVVQSSKLGVLDEAAREAVTRAAMPRPPAEIASQMHTMLVWVEFRLVSDD